MIWENIQINKGLTLVIPSCPKQQHIVERDASGDFFFAIQDLAVSVLIVEYSFLILKGKDSTYTVNTSHFNSYFLGCFS
jgi:hypothetical protein